MSEEEIAKLKDKILSILADNKRLEPKDIARIGDIDKSICSALCDVLEFEGHLRLRPSPPKLKHIKILSISDKGILFRQTSSYLSLFLERKRSESKDQVKKSTDRAVSNIYKLATICLGVISAIFTYNKYFVDDVKIDKLETEIENLSHINDSLILKQDTISH